MFTYSRLLGAALAVVVAVSAPLAALRQEIKLAYKWKPADVIRYRVVQTTTTALTGLPAGMPDVNVEQVTNQVFRTTVDSVAADGTTILNQVIETVSMDITSPMGKMAFDSTKPDTSNGAPGEAIVKEFFKAMTGETFTLTLSPAGRVDKVDGFSRVFEKVSKASAGDPNVLPILEGMKTSMSDEAIKNMFSQGFAEFPARALKPGDSWDMKTSVPNPLLGTLVTTTSATLSGVESSGGGQIAKIATKVKIERDPASPPGSGPMGLTAEMKGATGEGETLFDVAAGRMKRSSTTVLLPMTMSGTGPDGAAMSMQTNAKTTVTIELIEK